jgi:hypothetical protein
MTFLNKCIDSLQAKQINTHQLLFLGLLPSRNVPILFLSKNFREENVDQWKYFPFFNSLQGRRSPEVGFQILLNGKRTKPMQFYILIKKCASGQLNYKFQFNASGIGAPAVPKLEPHNNKCVLLFNFMRTIVLDNTHICRIFSDKLIAIQGHFPAINCFTRGPNSTFTTESAKT